MPDHNMVLMGKDILLKKLTPEDVTDSYVRWMNDKDVTRFLECRWSTFTKESLKKYVASMNKGDSNVLFGIFFKNNNEHIGNIKIGEINKIHKFAEIGLLIGNKSMWGKGYGSEAISLVTRYAFEELGLQNIKAGIYANNIGSYRAFMKAGYREVGRFKNMMFFEGSYVDEIIIVKGRIE